MKWIAHRGNMSGSNPNLENDPQYLKNTIQCGYDIETDVWLLDDGFYLGHDKPIYKIDRQFLQNQRIWSHCKNLSAYLELTKYQNVNCFFQENEEMVMTSRGYLWAHSKCNLFNEKTIIVSLNNEYNFSDKKPFAICSDYVINSSINFKLPFELLIIDIDGVMTNGTKMYDRDGKVFGKCYCDLDFTAIKRFQAAGIKVCFLSGDQNVNKAMAESRKIDWFHNPPGIDKVDLLPIIKSHYKTDQIAYIGDDYYDISIMNSVSLAFCPKNSPNAVLKAAHIINVDSGKGVIAGIYDMFERHIPYSYPRDSADVNPK